MRDSTEKTNRALAIVKNYMLGAMGAGLIPVPMIDLAALTAIQLKMLHSLAKHYGVPFSEQLGKSAIASLIGGSVPLSLTAKLGGLLTGVPLLSWITGTFGTALFGGASTYAIGKVFIQQFESGNTFLTFDQEQVRAYYQQQLDEGKEKVRKSFVGIKP